jgi:hypothetical protein
VRVAGVTGEGMVGVRMTRIMVVTMRTGTVLSTLTHADSLPHSNLRR